MNYLLLALLVPVTAFSFAPERKDPYSRKLKGPVTHELSIRVFNHSVDQATKWLKSQLKASEILFAQCGSRVKIQARMINWPQTFRSDHLLNFVDGKTFFSDQSLSIFQDALEGKRPQVLDVHIVDHLNKDIREAGTTINQSLQLGISFNPFIFGRVWNGSTPEVGGQHLFVAAETVRMNEKTFIRINNLKGHPRHLSLLAHEIGHQIFEGQINPESEYHDHWCDGMPDYCPEGNLMAGGGNEDKVWKNPETGRVEGFDPLPTLDKRQCELMLKHRAVKRI